MCVSNVVSADYRLKSRSNQQQQQQIGLSTEFQTTNQQSIDFNFIYFQFNIKIAVLLVVVLFSLKNPSVENFKRENSIAERKLCSQDDAKERTKQKNRRKNITVAKLISKRQHKMNAKKCVYRNCGNLSTSAPKLTFFSFPLKDVAKCKLWSEMAGCEDINLKHQYLCENHFNTIYVSKTPRRTVLLPNAVPYRWDENIIGTKDGSYGDGYGDGVTDGDVEYNLEKRILDPLISVDDENDIIYTTDDDQRQQIEMFDVDAIGEDEDDDGGNDELIVGEKVQKINAAAAPKRKMIEIDADGESIVGRTIGAKRVMMVQQQQQQKQPKHRMSLQSTGDFINHVTKRQKIHKDPLPVDQPQRKVRVVDPKKSIQPDEKHEYNNDKNETSGNTDDTGDGGNATDTAAAATTTVATAITDNDVTPDHNIPIDDTANNPDIATFNLKGEEFIQMPKRIYLAQRAQFTADLKRYRDILQNIKNAVNSID